MRVLVALLVAIPFLFAEAFGLMVLVATVHGEWLPMMPTIGYWSAFKVALAVHLLGVVCAFGYGISKGVMDK